MKVHIGGDLLKRIKGHLHRRETEQVAFLFMEPRADEMLAVVDAYLVLRKP